MIKVIATDMDGTFLDDKGSYDRERFERVFALLKAKGIRFVVASGNHMRRLSMIFEGMVDDLSYVAENGAHVLENNVELCHHHLPSEAILSCLAYFEGKHKDYRITVSTANHIYMVEGATFSAEDFMIDEEQLQTFLNRITHIKDLTCLPTDEPVVKIGMMFPLDACEQLIADFNQAFDGKLTAVTSGYGAIDVITTGVHKAWGLQHLLDKWQISPDEVMAFGDGENDIELLALAKYSYAMANAPESVKAVANYLAPDHRDNGVLKVIEDLVCQD